MCLILGVQTQALARSRKVRFGMGANFTNWLEAYWTMPNWPQPGKYQKSDLQVMKVAGMTTLRLPFCFTLIRDSLPPYAVYFASQVMLLLKVWTSMGECKVLRVEHF